MSKKKEIKKLEDIFCDADIIDWLSRCEKIDHGGYENGWAFERMESVSDEDDNWVGPVDVRLAVRGWEGENGLRKAAAKCMLAEIQMAKRYKK